MACMTHTCKQCSEEVFNNTPPFAMVKTPCSECGATDWHSDWDERNDHREEA